ncbi:MAG: hypothetical protein ACYDA3_13465 [Gaiellaceae bacterium]
MDKFRREQRQASEKAIETWAQEHVRYEAARANEGGWLDRFDRENVLRGLRARHRWQLKQWGNLEEDAEPQNPEFEAAEMTACPVCGDAVAVSLPRCWSCGTELPPPPGDPEPGVNPRKSPTVETLTFEELDAFVDQAKREGTGTDALRSSN